VRLRDCLRSSDLAGQPNAPQLNIDVARFGGDEFTVVLNNIESMEEAGSIAKRLLKHLQAPMQIEGHELVVTPSIGIAIAPDDAADCDELLKLADTAMYDAKTAGRNGISFFRRDMLKSSVGRMKLEADLRRAIARDELRLHYQPQVCAETGRIMGAEALVRWQDPSRGLVPPGEFIPLAEEMGLIVEIGAWTLLEACRNIAALTRVGLDVPKISVNVSSLQFNSEFTNLVRRALDEYGIDPARLELELTEGVIMGNAKASIAALHEMKSLGVSLSVDDFGTGYSSLSYLSQFPLDEIKIDRSFIVNLSSGRRSKDLVRAIIAMGKSLDLRLVAEGVDSLDQYRFLRGSEVDLIQGYLFSKPVPMEQFAPLIRTNPFREQIILMD
jgi:EAL domain-containing protein (putative c-di-GMP-specific phosphodiesterase class I)